jgi:hypothetical protein
MKTIQKIIQLIRLNQTPLLFYSLRVLVVGRAAGTPLTAGTESESKASWGLCSGLVLFSSLNEALLLGLALIATLSREVKSASLDAVGMMKV